LDFAGFDTVLDGPIFVQTGSRFPQDARRAVYFGVLLTTFLIIRFFLCCLGLIIGNPLSLASDSSFDLSLVFSYCGKFFLLLQLNGILFGFLFGSSGGLSGLFFLSTGSLIIVSLGIGTTSLASLVEVGFIAFTFIHCTSTLSCIVTKVLSGHCSRETSGPVAITVNGVITLDERIVAGAGALILIPPDVHANPLFSVLVTCRFFSLVLVAFSDSVTGLFAVSSHPSAFTTP
jgi:hypothetical protein